MLDLIHGISNANAKTFLSFIGFKDRLPAPSNSDETTGRAEAGAARFDVPKAEV
jgi:hypothetical protein